MNYVWGCSSNPYNQCGVSIFSKDNTFNLTEKVCSCCGSNCNGHQLDPILASSPDCSFGSVTTTVFTETTISINQSTTKSNNTSSDTIAIGILGGLLGVALIVIGVLSFKIYVYKKNDADNDRNTMVLNMEQ